MEAIEYANSCHMKYGVYKSEITKCVICAKLNENILMCNEQKYRYTAIVIIHSSSLWLNEWNIMTCVFNFSKLCGPIKMGRYLQN